MRKILALFIFVFAVYLPIFAQGRYDTNLQMPINCPCGAIQSFNSRQNIYFPIQTSGISFNCKHYSMLGSADAPEGFYLFRKQKRKTKESIYKKVAYYSMLKKLLAPDSIPFYAFNLQIK